MYLAIDIGATKTLVALFSASGFVLRKVKFPTAAERTKFLNDLVGTLEKFLSERGRQKLRAVTVAVPGHVRRETSGGGSSDSAPSGVGVEQKICSVNFGNREWGWFDLFTPLTKLFACPIYFENDANLAAVYESYGLKGRTLFLTFSTGIGGGLAENGRLLMDELEPGHTVYEYRGERAEWEDLAAASALEKAFHVAQATDLRGEEVMREVAKRIGLGLPSLVAEYCPDTVVIGGPMGKIFGKFAQYLPKLGVKYRRPKRPLESVIYGCYIFGKNQG